jgi:hypothetical protein
MRTKQTHTAKSNGSFVAPRLARSSLEGGFGNGLPNLVKISPRRIELGEEFAKFERTW